MTAPSTSSPAAVRTHSDGGVVVIRPRSGWIPIDWRELISHHELLLFLVMRDVKVRYKQTVLGVAWAVLQPLFAMIVFTVIFGNFAGFKDKVPGGVPYAVFVYAGQLPWMLFASTINTGAMSLVNQQQLLTKVYLPRLFVPASAAGGALVDAAVSFGVFLLLAVAMGVFPTAEWLAILPLTVLALAASLGVTFLLSALTVSYRDFRYVLPFMMQAWMYISPVIYPVDMVPQQYQWILALNPMAGIIDAFRAALIGQPWNWGTLGISAASSVLLLLLGMFYFRKTERRFADIA
jgi:lipopolysaccharide transport system permease protein